MATLHSYAFVFFGAAGDPAYKQFHAHDPARASASNAGGAE